MTLIPLPAQWAGLSAQGTRYELMNRTGEVSQVLPEEFYKKIDILGFDNFIRDLHLQEPDNFVGMILFDGEVEIVRDFTNKFLIISDSVENAPIEQVTDIIENARTLIAALSEHGEI